MKSSLLRVGYGLAIVLAVVYAFYTLRGPNGFPAWVDKRQQVHELEERNTALQREIQLKRERIERLKQNREEQELEIRKRLKLVKPNEKVYILGQ